MPFSNKILTPLCQVEFHTEEAVYSFEGFANDKKDPSNYLISVSTNKTLSAPTGSWSVDLLDNNKLLWYKKINPQDLVVIKMGNKFGELDTIMVGLVDEIRRKRSVGSKGELSVRTTISGRDFGKVLVKAQLKWFPQFRDGTPFPIPELLQDAFAGMMKTWFETPGGTPAELTELAIVGAVYNLMGFKIKYWKDKKEPVDATIKEIFRFRLQKADLIQPFRDYLDEFEGSAWNYMNGFQHDPFYELFLDTRTDYMELVPNTVVEKESFGRGEFEGVFGDDDAKVVLFFRQTPFDQEDWDTLETHNIEEEDIIEEDISRSDHDNYNMFHATPVLVAFDEVKYAQAVIPEFSSENILKYGISMLEKNVAGLPTGDDSGIKFGRELSAKLKEWYWRNIWFRNGSFIIRGNGKIKIGHRVFDKESNDVFYIEGVSNNFVNFGSWKTTLSVTRGQEMGKIEKKEIVKDIEPDGTVIKEKKDEPEPIYHTVISGDTLWGIALKYYNDGSQYKKIVSANKDVISNPDLIFPGQRFLIPDPINK